MFGSLMLWCVSYAFIFLLYIPLILLRIFGCYIPSQFRKKGCLLQAIWGGCELRNDRILCALGMEFRPLDIAIRDGVENFLSAGKVGSKLKLDF